MKKKIAVFVNGWNSENLQNFMTGMCQGIENEDIDLFVFLAHLSYGQSEDDRKSEQALFGLPNLSDFDGAIVYGSSLNFKETVEFIYNRCLDTGLPTVSIGLEVDNTHYIGIDNHEGMKALVEHIITEHNAKNVVYIGGDKGNKDSNERLEILRDTLAEHNLTLKDENIFYSDWEPIRGQNFLRDRLLSKDSNIDAVVCANDTLAIYATYGIEEAGYLCPEDICVTGFDYLKEGQQFYPSISSVKQDYVKLGIAAAEVFKNIFAGNAVDSSTVIQCSFIPGESCGCTGCRDDDRLRKEHARNYPRIRSVEDFKAGRLHVMDKAIMESENFEELPQKLQKLFFSTNGREGKTFYILMDPNFKELAYKSIVEMPLLSFANEMKVIVAKDEGEPINQTACTVEELIPSYNKDGMKHMYVFMPVHIDQYVYGYIVMADNLKYFGEMFYYKLVKQFREDLENYRQNLQLNELNARLNRLMQTDTLTGVKNRTAYENALATIKSEREAGIFESFAVAVFDINNLKATNDTLGHEVGDVYIKNCCRFICNSFKHSPVFRIGGDEFVVLIKGADYDNHEAIFADFKEKVQLTAANSSLSAIERISIASGMVDFNADFNGVLEDAIKQADEQMYINKREMKKC